jgi:hypothetical protein
MTRLGRYGCPIEVETLWLYAALKLLLLVFLFMREEETVLDSIFGWPSSWKRSSEAEGPRFRSS